MRMTLVNAFAVIITVLLFLVRHRCARQGIYSAKRREIQQRGSLHCYPRKQTADPHITMCSGVGDGADFEQDLFISNPKYKRDPEINVDNEEIGYYPMG